MYIYIYIILLTNIEEKKVAHILPLNKQCQPMCKFHKSNRLARRDCKWWDVAEQSLESLLYMVNKHKLP